MVFKSPHLPLTCLTSFSSHHLFTIYLSIDIQIQLYIPMDVFRPGATAVITGAASGIGFAAAQLCHRHGMDLVLLDINGENLKKAAGILPSTPEIAVSTFVLDVSRREEWEEVKTKVLAKHPRGIDLLMLNAGRSCKPAEGKTAWQDARYFETTFATNTFGYTNGPAAFLDCVIDGDDDQEKKRAVILTGSKQGITNPPGNPAYNASKSAVKSIAEQLSFDLHGRHPHVSVHLLVPGWVYTGMMTEHFPTKPAGCWTPEETVEFLVRKMQKGSFYIICPDNEVTEEMDAKRIAWACNDIVQDRPALSRWRADWKERAEAGCN
ncbi:hypothetical protein ASPZODRAFT_795678 [Penicilliopsis zonata CBS 506.65]|uniref:Short chain dehydrogenase/reductase n=1 Tax=Penicilliopsis zonata CBS 506.65 TaxID=1073090 RepID=A0A1L9SBC4_9EURO|nr:hypothetical protein ASPZODRAFT_795678 [Penicilliopsis zonata CBS 506.65]OJJ44480.1 hypothetical protein ASPZODRAFT_795678 [Penicilliopsis zonata CBS 506.65]